MSILFQLTFSDLNVCTVSNSTHTWIGLHHFVLQTSSSLNTFKHWATPIFLKKSKQFFFVLLCQVDHTVSICYNSTFIFFYSSGVGVSNKPTHINTYTCVCWTERSICTNYPPWPLAIVHPIIQSCDLFTQKQKLIPSYQSRKWNWTQFPVWFQILLNIFLGSGVIFLKF